MSTSESLELVTVTLGGKRDIAGGIKAPETGMTLDSPGGPVSSQGPYKREAGGSEAERDGRCCTAGCEDGGGAASQGRGASRSWKRREPMLPWSLRKDPPCPHLEFGLLPCRTVIRINRLRRSLVAQWLGLSAFTVKGLGSIPGGGTEIPHGQKEKKGGLPNQRPEEGVQMEQNPEVRLH